MNAHQLYIILTGVFVITLFNSCKKENMGDCLKSTGAIVTSKRNPGFYNALELRGKINLTIIPGSEREVVVEAGENLQALIKTFIKDDTLVIENANTCNWVRSYKPEINAYVTVDSLKSLLCTGAGNITATDTIQSEALYIEMKNTASDVTLTVQTDRIYLKNHTGSGDITIKGTTRLNYCYSVSNGFIYAEELKAEIASTSNYGVGDFYVHSDSLLTAIIEDIGNIYYSGQPKEITTNIQGKGELIKLD